MADSRPQKYVYVHTRPTNVCFNGVSLPVLPGDVLRCYPEFIEAFIPEKHRREVPKGSPKDSQPVKHNIPKTPVFLRPDPTGGLPMKSDPTVGPRLKERLPKGPVSPAIVEDKTEDNPYELVNREEEPTLDMGTGLDVPSVPEPRLEEVTTAPPAERKEPVDDIILDFTDDLTVPEAAEEEAEVAEVAEEVDEILPDIPSKTAFRKLKRDEMYELAIAHKFDIPEDAPKGVIVDTVWPVFYPEE